MKNHKKNNTQNNMVQKLLLMGTFITGMMASAACSAESYSQKLRKGTQPSQSQVQIRSEANKGHIPSKIIVLEWEVDTLSKERQKIEKTKIAHLTDLHNKNVLIDAKLLVDLETKESALQQHIFQIVESIHELEICKENKDKENDKNMYLSDDSDCLFLDDSEELEDELIVSHVKPEPTLNEILEDRLADVDSFLNWRLKANQKIKDKLCTLYDYVGSDSKIILDGFLEVVEKEILSNEAKISKDKEYLSHKPKTNKDKHNKILYCDKILNFDGYLGGYQYKYKIISTSIILEYIKKLAIPKNFLSSAHCAFLQQALKVIDDIIMYESGDGEYEEYSDHQKLVICREFLNSHDMAIKGKEMARSEKLEIAMATLHLASRQLKKINSGFFADEDGIYSEFYNLNNSVLSIEGKYVSWYLNQTYKSYNHLLFRGACINHDLINFCNFSQQIQEMIGTQNYYGIIHGLIGSKLFQLPICQNKQIIFVHKAAPYVFRLKNNGIYTIGLINGIYLINKNLNSFYDSYDNDVGDCYCLDSRFGYPAITEQDNELLKFIFYRSRLGGNLTFHGGVIPASYVKSLGWEENLHFNDRKNLLGDAHFHC